MNYCKIRRFSPVEVRLIKHHPVPGRASADLLRAVCELVYKPEARVDHLACRSIKILYEIARRSIENFEIRVQNNRFGLSKFNLGYRIFCLNSPKGYSRKIFSAQTG